MIKYGMRKKGTRLIAYKNTDRVCMCQIKFSSRERIMISMANSPQHSIMVMKLLAGIFPYRTIWEFSTPEAEEEKAHKQLISMFTDSESPEVNHPLDAIILRLVPCRSCDEAVSVLRQAEKAYCSR